MDSAWVIFGEVLLSFFAVVGMVYLCFEVIMAIKFGCKCHRLKVVIDAQSYSYDEILAMLKAMSMARNCRAASYLFDKLTVMTACDEEGKHLKAYLGRYADYANIQSKEKDEQFTECQG